MLQILPWNLAVKSNIIFDDADFELAVDQALNGGYFHAGQVCSAGSRILVQNSIKDKFEQALIDRVKNQTR